MRYLLDTCLISELVKPKPHHKVIEWLGERPTDTLYLCVLTIGELRKGITRLKESKKKQHLTLWLNTLVEDYGGRILFLDFEVSENWGLIQGKAEQSRSPMTTIDGLLATTALTHHLIIVSRNEGDFWEVPLLNPWK